MVLRDALGRVEPAGAQQAEGRGGRWQLPQGSALLPVCSVSLCRKPGATQAGAVTSWVASVQDTFLPLISFF